MGNKNPLLDCGGSLVQTRITVGEDLLRCANLDIFPMPKTCSTFGVLDDPDILTFVRLKAEEGKIGPDELDEVAKSETPRAELRRVLGLT